METNRNLWLPVPTATFIVKTHPFQFSQNIIWHKTRPWLKKVEDHTNKIRYKMIIWVNPIKRKCSVKGEWGLLRGLNKQEVNDRALINIYLSKHKAKRHQEKIPTFHLCVFLTVCLCYLTAPALHCCRAVTAKGVGGRFLVAMETISCSRVSVSESQRALVSCCVLSHPNTETNANIWPLTCCTCSVFFYEHADDTTAIPDVLVGWQVCQIMWNSAWQWFSGYFSEGCFLSQLTSHTF